MRVALDSSALIAAYISRAGVCAELLEDVLIRHQLVTFDYILEEVARKLSEKLGVAPDAVERVRTSIADAAHCVVPVDIPAERCHDRNDLPILGTPLAGAVDLLIAVDKNLLALEEVDGIPIVRPGAFWQCAGH